MKASIFTIGELTIKLEVELRDLPRRDQFSLFQSILFDMMRETSKPIEDDELDAFRSTLDRIADEWLENGRQR